jgi:hypothetical protein
LNLVTGAHVNAKQFWDETVTKGLISRFGKIALKPFHFLHKLLKMKTNLDSYVEEYRNYVFRFKTSPKRFKTLQNNFVAITKCYDTPQILSAWTLNTIETCDELFNLTQDVDFDDGHDERIDDIFDDSKVGIEPFVDCNTSQPLTAIADEDADEISSIEDNITNEGQGKHSLIACLVIDRS